MKIETKELAYILGFIWADGSIYKNKKCDSYKCTIECVKEDLLDIEHIFQSVKEIKWRTSFRDRPNRKPQMSILTCDRNFCKFLIRNDYSIKSGTAPNKILNLIPNNLKIYFLRGLSDGDGCFYLSSNKMTHQYSIASTFDQDWTFIENFFNMCDIRYNINRRISTKNHKSSVIRLTSRYEIFKLGKILYYVDDGIYLSRKYKKYLNMIEEHEKTIHRAPRFKKDKSTPKIYNSLIEI